MSYNSNSYINIDVEYDNGFVVVGSLGDPSSCNIIKFDKEGKMSWYASYGGEFPDFFIASISLVEDESYIALGHMLESQDSIIVKYSIKYDLENVITENGVSTVEQQGKYAVITPASNDGYEIEIPFTGGKTWDIGIFAIPLMFFVVIGTVNGVNFTDGLDGLASSVTVLVATFFTVVAIGTQSDKTKWWLFALCTGVPQLTGILAVIPKFLYPLSGNLRNQMYSELMQRRRDLNLKMTDENQTIKIQIEESV